MKKTLRILNKTKMMLVKILLIFANIIIVCAAGIGCFVGFHDKKVSYLFAMSCFCCIIALIMILKNKGKSERKK